MLSPQNIQFPIKLGSRASPLAIRQAQIVADKIKNICKINEDDLKIIPIKTKGDKVSNSSIAEIATQRQGVFVRELENALLQEHIDIAIHSLKDMPALIETGLEIIAVMPRDDPRDSLICIDANSIETLPKNAILGTSSVRRAKQVKRYRGDINIIPLRGNIETRLNAVIEGKINATFLAKCGLDRLNIKCQYANHIPVEKMLPAAAQAIIAVQIKSDKLKFKQLLTKINHQETMYCAIAERAFLKKLEAGCSMPVAAYAQIHKQNISLRAELFKCEENKYFEAQGNAHQNFADKLGNQIAQEIIIKTQQNIRKFYER